MKPSIDVNADLGEGFPWDAEILRRVTSANVCCGAHAGDAETIRETLRLAHENGVVVGAHPGYADRENFGRKRREVSREVVKALVLEQVEWLATLANALGIEIRYIKPHGALYNQAQDEVEIASGVVEAARELGLAVLGTPGSEVERAAGLCGVRFVAEGFVERGYQPNGRLLDRGLKHAIYHNPHDIVWQTLRMASVESCALEVEQTFGRLGRVFDHESWPRVESLCIHGDRKESVDIADLVRATLRLSGVGLREWE